MTDTTPQPMTFCPSCGGRLEAGKVTHRDHATPGTYRIVENVPALVCPACGEYFLSPEVVEAVERLVAGGRPNRQVVTAFYDFEQA